MVSDRDRIEGGGGSATRREPGGWIAAGGCISLIVISCAATLILAGLGWALSGRRSLAELLPLEKYPVLDQWLDVLQSPFRGNSNQLHVLQVSEVIGDALPELEQEFRERDRLYDDLLGWVEQKMGSDGEAELISGSVVLLEEDQKAGALLYQVGSEQFLAVQSWLTAEADTVAVTFILTMVEGSDGDPLLYLGTQEGMLQIASDGVDETEGKQIAWWETRSSGDALDNVDSSHMEEAAGFCRTTNWEDYQRCLTTNSSLWGYEPGFDCIPDLGVLQRVWKEQPALVPTSVLRALVGCGSPAVQCMTSAPDQPPQGIVLDEPVLVSDQDWRTCEGNQVSVVPAYEIRVVWEDDRDPFSSAGEQVHLFPASDQVAITVEDCGGTQGIIEFELNDSWTEQLITCSSGQQCVEEEPGVAGCQPVPPARTPEPTRDVDSQADGEATPGVLIQSAGSIHRGTNACTVLEGACSVEEQDLSIQYESTGGSAQGTGMYSEAYPSRNCGSNSAIYRFTLEGLFHPDGGFDLNWSLERSIILNGGVLGNCRSTSTVLTDTGVSEASINGNGLYEGEIVISSGERFIYEFNSGS